MRFKSILVRLLVLMLIIGGVSLFVQIRLTAAEGNHAWIQTIDLKVIPGSQHAGEWAATNDTSPASAFAKLKDDTFIFIKREDKVQDQRRGRGLTVLSDEEKLKQKWRKAIERQAKEILTNEENKLKSARKDKQGTPEGVSDLHRVNGSNEDDLSSQYDRSIEEDTPASGVLNRTKWFSKVDPHEYPYILNAKKMCADGEDTFKRLTLLIMVVSEPGSYRKRQIIRQTFAVQPARFATSVTATVFLLGKGPAEGMTQFDLEKESQKYGDIVQEDFLDSYLNLSVKSVMGLKWATKFCPRSKFVLKIDDDMSLNIERLLTYLRRSPLQNFFGGKAAIKFPVLRDPQEKFYVPWSVYSEEYYPPYCVGLGYVMSTDLVYKLYFRSLTTPLFPWEDVFVGMLLKHYAVTPKDIPNFFVTTWNSFHSNGTMKTTTHNVNKLKAAFTLHGLTPFQNAQVWSLWTGKSNHFKYN